VYLKAAKSSQAHFRGSKESGNGNAPNAKDLTQQSGMFALVEQVLMYEMAVKVAEERALLRQRETRLRPISKAMQLVGKKKNRWMKRWLELS
jgi:hypothetical protein